MEAVAVVVIAIVVVIVVIYKKCKKVVLDIYLVWLFLYNRNLFWNKA